MALAQGDGAGTQDIDVTFTRSGLAAGFWRGMPIAVSVFAYGIVFGVLARQAGLSGAEAVLMSAIVFAGASQFVAVGMWASPVPLWPLALTTFVVNLRHVLMGAALSPWFSRLRPSLAYPTLFLMADENWALTMREFAAGRRDAAFLLGSGLALFAAWTSSTLAGHLAATAIPDPSRWGLDFAFTAVFVALLVGLWKGKSSLLPWGAAAFVALLAPRWLPGRWYILLAGLAGSLVGAIMGDPAEELQSTPGRVRNDGGSGNEG